MIICSLARIADLIIRCSDFKCFIKNSEKIQLRLNNAHSFRYSGLEINFHKVYHLSTDKTVNFLVLLPRNLFRIQNNFNSFSMIDVQKRNFVGVFLKVIGHVLLVTAVIFSAFSIKLKETEEK